MPDDIAAKPPKSRWVAWKIVLAIALAFMITGIVIFLVFPDGVKKCFGGRTADNAVAPQRAQGSQRARGDRALPGAVAGGIGLAGGAGGAELGGGAGPAGIGGGAAPPNARATGDAAMPDVRFISMDTETILTSPPSATGDRLSRLLATDEWLVVGAPGKGRIYVFRAVVSGWEQMRTLDRPNGFGSALAAHGSRLYVADANQVAVLSLPDLSTASASIRIDDTERLMCAVATGALIVSSETVRIGNVEIYRSHNEINRVRATHDGRIVICTTVNTVLLSADHSVEKTFPIPSLDAVEVREGTLAVSRYDEETVVLINVASGRELSRASLPGGADRPTGYGQTMVLIGANTLAVAAPYDNVSTAVETGSVFLYRIDGNDMFVHEMLNTPEVVENAHFGEHMVSMGNRLLVSSERIAGNAGRISVFSC